MYKQNRETADSYKIRDFVPEDLKQVTGGCMAILGGTGSGKTVVLKDILSHIHTNYDSIIMMSATAKLQPAYDFMPRSMIIDDYDEQILKETWDRQVEKFKDGSLKPVLIILDDIIASPAYRGSKMLNQIAISARHLGITLIILSQYFTAIKPLVRTNLRLAITFAMPSKRERDKFVCQYLSADNQIVGEMLLRRITGGYQCLIVECYKCGAGIEECVKKYTANMNVKLKIKDHQDQTKQRKIKKITLK